MSEYSDYNSSMYYSCNETEALLSPAALVVTSVAFTTIFCVGVTGNLLVALVIWRHQDMRNSTNYFLLNLSVADMLVLMICVPAGLLETFFPMRGWPLGKFMCYFVLYSENLAANASILTLLAIAVERYYVICTPFKAHYICTPRRTLLICVCVWLISALVNVPLMVMVYYKKDCLIDDYGQTYVCFPFINTRWEVIYETAMSVIFFLIPSLFLTVIYYVIANTLRKHKVMMASIRDTESKGGSFRSQNDGDSPKPCNQTKSLQKQRLFQENPFMCDLFRNFKCCCCLAMTNKLNKKPQCSDQHMETEENLTELNNIYIAEQDSRLPENDAMLSVLRSRDEIPRVAQSHPLQRRDTPSTLKTRSMKEKPAVSIYATDIKRHQSSTSVRSSGSSRNSYPRRMSRMSSVTPPGVASAISRRSHQRVILMLAHVVVVFFVCWMPVRVINLWGIYATEEEFSRLTEKQVLIIATVCRVLVYLNSAINPVLYNLISTKFRAAFKSVLSCASGPGRKRTLSSRSLSSTSSFRFTKKSVDHVC